MNERRIYPHCIDEELKQRKKPEIITWGFTEEPGWDSAFPEQGWGGVVEAFWILAPALWVLCWPLDLDISMKRD